MKINNIHCLALNYKGVGEINQDPIYFLKSTSCLAYEESEVKYPKFNTTEVWTEVELGIFISEDCENINEEEVKLKIKELPLYPLRKSIEFYSLIKQF